MLSTHKLTATAGKKLSRSVLAPISALPSSCSENHFLPANLELGALSSLPEPLDLSNYKEMCFEKHFQRALVAQTGLFLQPSSHVLHTTPFADPGQNLSHVVRLTSELLNCPKTKYLKPTGGSLGERVVKLRTESGELSLSSADRTLARLREMVPKLSTIKIDDSRREELIGEHPLGQSFFMHTGLTLGSNKDLLVRLLSSAPRWMVEDEIPGTRLDGAPCEVRFICVYNPRTEQIAHEAHYSKIGGNEVAANLRQGGGAITGDELIARLTGWNSSTRQAWLDEIGQRACLLAEHNAKATKRPEALSVSVDVMPQGQAGRLLPWFLEMNIWCYQSEGLRMVDPTAFERVENSRKALANLLRNRKGNNSAP